jgi:hypothetical protein
MAVSADRSKKNAEQQERTRQLRGLVLIAVAIIVFSVLRFGAHRVFTRGWWRLW